MKTNSILILAFKIIALTSTYSQKLEFDLGIGVHLSNIDFHHSSTVDTNDDSGFQAFGNANFRLGLTAPLMNNKWFLKTEMGFLKTNSFFVINYKYDDGLEEKNALRVTYLLNQKLYLSISPEYRININPIAITLNGGLIFTSDISNIMSTSNTVLVPKSFPFGIKLGASIQYMWEKIGMQFNISYLKIGSSELQNRWHPRISYNLISLSYGLIYSI